MGLIWHPHTDSPGTAETALIAVTRHSSEPYLIGIAENRAGRWHSEEFGDLIEPPYWWADEQILVGLINGKLAISDKAESAL